jgi:Uma2 family endonuclease
MGSPTTADVSAKGHSRPMSYDAYLEWADENTHAEWVNGEVIEFMPAKDRHQAVVGFLYSLLRLFVDLFERGQVRVAPLGMRLTNSVREPDIFFVAQAHLERLTEDRLQGPADLVVEVISDDSVRRDRDEKFREYREAGVREYWIIDPRPDKQRADFYRLEAGEYILFATEDEAWVDSAVLNGFGLRPTWLWEAKTAVPLTCALEIDGVASRIQQQLDQQQE